MTGRLAAERRSRILEEIRQNGSVSVNKMARELGVSVMTIRRDLALMDREGLIERCHGGAVVQSEVSYGAKRQINQKSKELIAAVCAEMVEPGMRIYLDAGTTTWEIARRIKSTKNIVVLTNDIEIARLLYESEVNLFMLGGQVQNSTGSAWGYFASQMVEKFNLDLGFFGASCVDENLEISTPTADKAFLKRTALNHCARSVLAVDSGKFGKKAMIAVNKVSDYHVIVTDYELSDPDRNKLEDTEYIKV